ncbi:MAG: DNA primase [Rickettsiales bacterium]
MKYPQSFIEEIRNRVRVSEVVGKSVSLRRAGREFQALCPFHKEKSPSFTVNDEKGFFHCFGCGAHGDVIGFVMDYEHLRYTEAIEKLAGLAGLTLPTATRAEVEREAKSQSLQQVMETVTAWLQSQLDDTSEGELARDYLKSRGLSPDTVAKFRLGYAPADRDALARAMKTKGITEAQLIECGMLIQVDDRAPYCRFRRRLMFPIRDRRSRVIAFGGRVLPGEPNADAPKYLNSPETPLFHKGRQLFNLDLARSKAFEVGQLVVCEGYMDVIALAQGGIHHAVAPLGTAITAEQLQLCWQLVDEPILCLDGDNAGQRAMTRAMELALPLLVPGKTLRLAVLPKGDDPDSLIKNHGREAFEAVLASAQPLSSMLWSQTFSATNTTPEARAAQEQELMLRIGQIKHPSVQQYYKQFVKERLREAQQANYHRGLSSRPRAGTQPQNGRGSNGWAGSRDPAFAKGFGGHSKPGMTTSHMPPPPLRPTDNSLRAPAANLIALAIACPSLLREAAAEEFWLHAPMPSAELQQLHHRITEFHIDTPAITAEELWHLLSEELSADILATPVRAMETLGIALTYDETVRTSRAQRLWGEVVNDVDRARLKAECAQAEALMAAEMNDENLQRFLALKGQLEALERERSRFYRQDPLSATGTE